ncbi:MAG: bifunctional phosphoribosyl-AMP cyclohydrolase/phosphoribosyl-ATP diphosphatase HisIE [Elusimicrobiota bacterium]
MKSKDLGALAWRKMGDLLPAVVQDAGTRQVLMLGYMNPEALAKTLKTGLVTFYSRSKKRLWQKGETSGNTLRLVDIVRDCDSDALLVSAEPKGPACHRDTASCFAEEAAPGLGFLGRLDALVEDRRREMPEGSYTSKLFKEGVDRAAQKVGEEAVEVAIAAKNPDRDALAAEAADLLYHLMVLLRCRDMCLSDVIEVLRRRHRA